MAKTIEGHPRSRVRNCKVSYIVVFGIYKSKVHVLVDLAGPSPFAGASQGLRVSIDAQGRCSITLP